jgi:hypothetical protein
MRQLDQLQFRTPRTWYTVQDYYRAFSQRTK